MTDALADALSLSPVDRFHGIIDRIGNSFCFLMPPSSPTYPQLYKWYYWRERLRDGTKKYEIHLDKKGLEVLRGGIIRATASWEAFVIDLLRKAFDNLIERAENLTQMKENWGKPKKKGVIAGPDRLKVALDEALERRCKNNKKSESSVLETLNPENDWRDLLKVYHAAPILEGNIRPVLCGSNSIDSAVTKLFKVYADNKDKDGILNSSWAEKRFPLEVAFFVQPPNPTKVTVTHSGLMSCSLLYYGFRCVLAHGIPNKTLKNGVLKDFDNTLKIDFSKDDSKVSTNETAIEALGFKDTRSDEELQKAGAKRSKPAKMLLTLRENIQKYESPPDSYAVFSYQTWLNMCIYLKLSATWLDQTINDLIAELHDSSNLC